MAEGALKTSASQAHSFTQRDVAMLKNYFTVAVRNLIRYKMYATINIVGLAIGIACCALILCYVQNELGYDSFHKKADQTYRVAMAVETKDGLSRAARTSAPIGKAILDAYPEVTHLVRFFPPQPEGFGPI